MRAFTNLEEACIAAGVEVPNRQRPGCWIPCPLIGKSKSNTSGRVLLFTDGKGGIVHNWVTGERTYFFYEGFASMNKQEREAMWLRIREQMARTQREIERRQELASRKAAELYYHLGPQSEELGSLYADNKGCGSEPFRVMTTGQLKSALGYLPLGSKGKRLEGNVIVLPIKDIITSRIASLQFIDDTGSKAMLAGGAIKGNCITELGLSDLAPLEEVGIAEGWATSLSVTRLYDVPCIAALSCNNLKTVALKLHDACPWLSITIYGDVGNGSKEAREAAAAVNGRVKFPAFLPGQKGTDFNDWELLNDR